MNAAATLSPTDAMGPDALLRIEGLGKRFGGVTALDSYDMEISRGDIVGLIGPNGSGKTTSFNLVTGIYKPSNGRIIFDGRDITALSPQEVYRAGIARTFQRSRLCLPLSIFDNIMIGDSGRLNKGLWFNLINRRAFRRQFEEGYQAARDLVHTFSPSLADRMFDPVAALPMIERRRIEICRALISRPKLLLLDEPSAGMTHDETRQLMEDILDVRQRIPGLSIVIIEHEMGVIERITDKCVVLNYGRKICEGTYAEISNDPEVRKAYLGAE